MWGGTGPGVGWVLRLCVGSCSFANLTELGLLPISTDLEPPFCAEAGWTVKV